MSLARDSERTDCKRLDLGPCLQQLLGRLRLDWCRSLPPDLYPVPYLLTDAGSERRRSVWCRDGHVAHTTDFAADPGAIHWVSGKLLSRLTFRDACSKHTYIAAIPVWKPQ